MKVNSDADLGIRQIHLSRKPYRQGGCRWGCVRQRRIRQRELCRDEGVLRQSV